MKKPTKGDSFKIIHTLLRGIDTDQPAIFVRPYCEGLYLMSVTMETGTTEQRSFFSSEIKAI